MTELYKKHPNECPRVDRSFIPTPEDHNIPKEYVDSDGTYVFFYHFDGFDTWYNCQFCQGAGRMRDVFRCLNRSEWESCSYNNFPFEK